MNILEDVLIEAKQCTDKLMHKSRDTYLNEGDYFEKLFGKKAKRHLKNHCKLKRIPKKKFQKLFGFWFSCFMIFF